MGKKLQKSVILFPEKLQKLTVRLSEKLHIDNRNDKMI